MIGSIRTIALAALLATSGAVFAQVPPSDGPSVNVTASATMAVANDRLQAWVRAEAEHADPATAASSVNATIAKGLARAKAVAGLTVTTSGYSTQQLAEKGRPTRWRVTQMITMSGTDFAAIATLLTRMQEQDGLLLSGMSFSLSPNARDNAERTLIQQAIRGWQLRAQVASAALGFEAWRPGHLTVQANDGGRVFPTMRASAMAADAAPVNVEGGTTEVTVSVSGEARLDQARIAR